MKLITLNGKGSDMLTPIDLNNYATMGAEGLTKSQVKSKIKKIENLPVLSKQKRARLSELKNLLWVKWQKPAKAKLKAAAAAAQANRGKILIAAVILGAGAFLIYKQKKKKRR